MKSMVSIHLIPLLFCLVVLHSSSVSNVEGSTCGKTILRQDFNEYPEDFIFWSADRINELFPAGAERRSGDGAVRKSGALKGGSVGLERLMVGHKMARIDHQEGCVGAKSIARDGRPCGVLLQVRLEKPVDAATLTYKVKFSQDFDWTLGGKLPGLCSESATDSATSLDAPASLHLELGLPLACVLPSSASDSTQRGCPVGCTAVAHNSGWSNRIMWRRAGHLVSYAYQPDKLVRCGMDFRWQQRATAGDWHEIKLFMKMNDPGVSNGVQKVWFNRKTVFERQDMLYRNRPGHKIEKFIFNNFHGGNANGRNAPAFAPQQDQSIWIDDILIQQGECPGVESDYAPALGVDPLQGPNVTESHGQDLLLQQQHFSSSISELTLPTGSVEQLLLRGREFF